MLLDTGAEVFVWVGAEADQAERDKAQDLATKYIESHPSDR